jgi:hypothetical protein
LEVPDGGWNSLKKKVCLCACTGRGIFDRK